MEEVEKEEETQRRGKHLPGFRQRRGNEATKTLPNLAAKTKNVPDDEKYGKLRFLKAKITVLIIDPSCCCRGKEWEWE